MAASHDPNLDKDGNSTDPVLKHHDPSYLPIERFMTIDGLLRSHANEVDQTPLVCYPDQGISDFVEHTAAALNQYVDATVQYYVEHGLEPANPDTEKAPVVALLSPSSLDVICSIFALNRLGWTVLFLSTRLTGSAYARLLDMAQCDALIMPNHLEPIYEDIRKERSGCMFIPIVERSSYHGVVAPNFQRSGLDSVREGNKIAWILHSSGSTGFPKPIFLTNLQCLANFRKTFGMKAFCSSPLFHSHGLMELFRAFYNRSAIYFTNFAFPVTAHNILEALTVAQPELVVVVPYILKLLAESERGINALAKAKLVLFGGSSCPDELGDRLVDNGVHLAANYGATETGQIMTSFRPRGDREWQYMRLQRPAADFTLMDEIAPGVFECVGLDGLPSKGHSNSKPPYSATNPPRSFRTADLFTRHPDPKKSNYYKYLSRLDDRITLVNGEKVLPIAIEGRIRQDELVKEAVVFGYQQSTPGVLVFRSSEHGLGLTDEEYLSVVWPVVEAANTQAETFSRIPKELVIVKGPNVPYPRTDKRTFIRAQVYQQFANDIRAVYESFENSDTIDQSDGLELDMADLEKWLVHQFKEVSGLELHVLDDVFSAGIDSLQSIRLWHLIKRNLDLGQHSNKLSQNVVFEKGTIRELAKYLCLLKTDGGLPEVDDPFQIMDAMISRYSNFLQHVPSEQKWPEKEIIVLTGATGNLGAYLLAEFSRRRGVAEIWALVRSSGQTDAATRVWQSLSKRKIVLTVEESSKIHALFSDFSQPDLGLQTEDLNYLLSATTCIVHSAWAVNFNLDVRSFEHQHIRGTHNLINFCLRSRLPNPARFWFCSSISTVSATPKSISIPECTVESFRYAQHTGYGRSKLITEHVTQNAARKTGIQAKVLRIGQLSGDLRNAVWDDTEAVALMIRSVLTVGALPALDKKLSWLPVDICAQAIADLAVPSSGSWNASVSQRNQDAEFVYHLVNPKTFDWTKDMVPALRRTDLPQFIVISISEWLARLSKSEPDPTTNPSIKLIEYWRTEYSIENRNSDTRSDDVSTSLKLETKHTVECCAVLGKVSDPVSQGLVERYVERWLQQWVTEAVVG